MRRVVVTGLGTINPLGNDVESSWNSLINSKSGISKISKFNVDNYPCKIAGSIDDFLISEDIVSQRDQRKIDRFITLGLIAASEAIKDSGFKSENENSYRYGVMVGSGIGGLDTIYKNSSILENQGIRKISPFFIPSSLINLLSGHMSIKYNLKGPNYSTVSACASSAHAIGESFRLIQHGQADIMMTGGSEATISPVGIEGFTACRALSTKYNDYPENASRPFDEARDGFVMGEGGGILILEEMDHALNRDANIFAEIKGYGMSSDAYHYTLPEPSGDGAYRAMDNAIKDAIIEKDQIDYINAHGTSTPAGDEVEALAIDRMFKNNKSKVNVSSTKSQIGHLLGAAGAVESIYSILSINNSIAPFNLNLENEISTQNINFIKNNSIELNIENVLTNSFGFGGTNVSLVLSKFNENK